MTSFARGTLAEKISDYGQAYRLMFRFAGDNIIPVNDTTPISSSWTINTEYHLLLKIRIKNITYLPAVHPDTVLGTVREEIHAGGRSWQETTITRGRVLDPLWDAAEHTFKAVASRHMYKQTYVIIETAIGNIVVSHDTLASELGEEQMKQLAVGDYLEWEPARIDLWAWLPDEGEVVEPSQDDLALWQRYKGGRPVVQAPANNILVASDFVHARLEEIKCDIVACRLKLRVKPEVMVVASESKDVLKPDPGPLASQMKIDGDYHLLLLISPLRPHYFTEMPAQATLEVEYREEQFIDANGRERYISAEILEGRVLDPAWDPASRQYQAITNSPSFYRERYVLLETAIGTAVVSHDQLERSLGAHQVSQIQAGGYMEWPPSRMELLAIL